MTGKSELRPATAVIPIWENHATRDAIHIHAKPDQERPMAAQGSQVALPTAERVQENTPA
ncbi:hypothetical protein N7539_001544 [Penicillium diatomitis]|uniref:Uncharacterized protein n=1 Tax=Penicillium diatomitis TaxID=2819901 RepID=A0A9W9XGV4_9EURO|nr:uncharacterized protein N7539_001544 [Penicillium diatomitis]KAJ5492798.1 hypothetical protein N7539_001544 [Penicillium diatomitis]